MGALCVRERLWQPCSSSDWDIDFSITLPTLHGVTSRLNTSRGARERDSHDVIGASLIHVSPDPSFHWLLELLEGLPLPYVYRT
ncbi:hypothetical protein TNIN_447121 [Trichonephila inaurata madagascariensis]|uniref:Uncharacterized protein n=1 Tax=Trichonephila inaurata madagascariensis TaxID=2747483 RepID=A0A8X6YTX1_9ARAC|nr:hypothetical protein TNIN_447121 [Trichonephila inaurata madagascariensis]